MKSFKQHLQEVEFHKKSSGEDNFADKHVVDVITDPHNDDRVHKGTGEKPDAKKKPQKIPAKKARKADYKDGEDASVFEEVDQLQELSKKTMGRYIKAASKDAATNKGFSGFNQAIKRKYKEVADRDSSLAKVASAVSASHDKAEKYGDKQAEKRLTGIKRATDKLTKEETELQELSKDLVKKYAEKTKDAKSSRYSIKDPMGAKRMAKQIKYGVKARTYGEKADQLHKNDVAEDAQPLEEVSGRSAKMAPKAKFKSRGKTAPGKIPQQVTPLDMYRKQYFQKTGKKMEQFELNDGSTVELSESDSFAIDYLYNKLDDENQKLMEAKMAKSGSSFDKVLTFARDIADNSGEEAYIKMVNGEALDREELAKANDHVSQLVRSEETEEENK
jgi:hypothetical protein